MTLAEFVKTAASLKSLKRSGWIDKLSIADGESVADHSYSAAVVGMVLSDVMKLDSERVVKMALLHDLAESRIGDIIPGKMTDAEKRRIEEDAFSDIVSQLPQDIRSEYLSIWDEFCAGVTPEARLVRQADKIDMALQAIIYGRAGRGTYKDTAVFVDEADKVVVDETARSLFSDITAGKKTGGGSDCNVGGDK